MRRRTIRPGVRQGRPIGYNAGLEIAYRRKLEELVREMSDSTTYWLRAAYRRQEAKIEAYSKPSSRVPDRSAVTGDASPVSDLLDRLRKQRRRWIRRFSEHADAIADWFVRSALRSADTQTRASLSDLAGFTVQFQGSRGLETVLQSIIAENVALITSIPRQYLLEVEGIVMRGVREGRDLGFVTDELRRRYDITWRRANTIARDQTHKAMQSLSRERLKQNGITRATWVHVGGTTDPRPSHVAAHGKEFDIATGLEIDGERIFPGQKINCRCRMRPVVASFSASVRGRV
jgi:SPP1 gp7 family putative phage head morphogenesis protein